MDMGKLGTEKSFEQYYGLEEVSFSEPELNWKRSFNVADIYKCVNAAQKKDATRPERAVSAVPDHLSVGRASSSVRGQDVNRNIRPDPHMPPPPPPPHTMDGSSGLRNKPEAIGYNLQHHSYNQALKKAQASTYAKSDKAISVAFHIGVEAYSASRGKKSSHMPDLRSLGLTETDPQVSAYATPSDLRERAVTLLWTRFLHKYPDFPGQLSDCSFREIAPVKWTNIDLQPLNVPYFLNRPQVNCARRGAKGATGGDTPTEFHYNDKPFEVALVLSSEVWDQYEEMLESKEVAERGKAWESGNLKPGQSTAGKKKSTTSSNNLFTEVEDSECSDWGRRYENGTLLLEDSQSSILSQPEDGERPQKKISLWESPPHGNVQRRALMGGGAISASQVERFNSTEYIISYYPVLTPSWTSIIKSITAGKSPMRFEIDGKTGSFRTAHRAALTFENMVDVRMQPIIAKRPYKEKRKTKGRADAPAPMARYSSQEELERVVGDGNMHMFVSSLFSFAESWIGHLLKSTGIKRPVQLPNLAYVNAGVATCHDAVVGTTTKSLSSRHMALMLEDEISDFPDSFCKYINNGSASIEDVVNDHPEDDHFRIAVEYLASIQHILFWKTDGCAYLSDFQGCNGKLTDGQVMTAPYVVTELRLEDLSDLLICLAT
ncbi:hypothetical protein VKT23_011925 [Stygiomarasmius scandens]|uniref:Alpha-type protein kinase domain-containing protein n=1 Tax=Marasmiellus scandens TaxID=2682957 RepID=A0ABR1J846_9AGAR